MIRIDKKNVKLQQLFDSIKDSKFVEIYDTPFLHSAPQLSAQEETLHNSLESRSISQINLREIKPKWNFFKTARVTCMTECSSRFNETCFPRLEIQPMRHPWEGSAPYTADVARCFLFDISLENVPARACSISLIASIGIGRCRFSSGVKVI